MTDDTRLFSLREAHRYLAERGCVYAQESLKKRRAKHPESPAFKKIGGRIRYTKKALDDFLAGAI